MAKSRLSPLQLEALRALTGVEPPWTLTGGGALAGAWLGHRETRDLDLFWRDRESLGELPDRIEDRLRAAGLTVVARERTPAFVRLEVARGSQRTLVDLVADPTPWIEPAVEVTVDDLCVRVDISHELLVNKLTTLLSRSEIRDLVDVRALVAAGGDLDRALADAPRKDAGFSSVTLAWVLEQLPVRALGVGSNLGAEEVAALDAFRNALVVRLKRSSRP